MLQTRQNFPNGNPKPGAFKAFEAGYEPATIEGSETYRGRDPRRMPPDQLRSLGHQGIILKAVRENCLQCCAGNDAEVRTCRLIWCPMWPYRMGANPFNRRTLTEDARKVLADRLAKRSGQKTG